SSAYSSSDRYAAVLRSQEAIARSLPVFENSEYLTEILVRYPEELTTLGEFQLQAPRVSSASLFDVPATEFGDGQLSSGDPVFHYIASSTAAYGEKIALLRQQFRHRMFASGARDLAEHRSVYSSLAETNSAAEDAIAAAFSLAGAPAGFAVCALGR